MPTEHTRKKFSDFTGWGNEQIAKWCAAIC